MPEQGGTRPTFTEVFYWIDTTLYWKSGSDWTQIKTPNNLKRNDTELSKPNNVDHNVSGTYSQGGLLINSLLPLLQLSPLPRQDPYMLLDTPSVGFGLAVSN